MFGRELGCSDILQENGKVTSEILKDNLFHVSAKWLKLLNEKQNSWILEQLEGPASFVALCNGYRVSPELE